jgi:hypothetical protein
MLNPEKRYERKYIRAAGLGWVSEGDGPPNRPIPRKKLAVNTAQA